MLSPRRFVKAIAGTWELMIFPPTRSAFSERAPSVSAASAFAARAATRPEIWDCVSPVKADPSPFKARTSIPITSCRIARIAATSAAVMTAWPAEVIPVVPAFDWTNRRLGLRGMVTSTSPAGSDEQDPDFGS